MERIFCTRFVRDVRGFRFFIRSFEGRDISQKFSSTYVGMYFPSRSSSHFYSSRLFRFAYSLNKTLLSNIRIMHRSSRACLQFFNPVSVFWCFLITRVGCFREKYDRARSRIEEEKCGYTRKGKWLNCRTHIEEMIIRCKYINHVILSIKNISYNYKKYILR